ncbi:hypothetical protein C0J52_20379 [Blattella germanica]|nr:hypothetical protein C0J52_20379 [Blattella germanica]
MDVSVMPLSPQDVARAIAMIDDGRSLRYAARTIVAPYTMVQEASPRHQNCCEVPPMQKLSNTSQLKSNNYTKKQSKIEVNLIENTDLRPPIEKLENENSVMFKERNEVTEKCLRT